MDQRKEKTRILFAGDSLAGYTGLSYVISSFMRMFKQNCNNKYEFAYITLIGHDSSHGSFLLQGDKFEKMFKNNLKVYNAQLLNENGMEEYNKAILDFKPHIVFSNLDPWNLDQIAFSIYRSSYYWVQYLTIETPFYPEIVMYPTYVVPDKRKSMRDILNRANLIIPATNMGKKVLENMGVKTMIAEHVYNGIDMEIVCKECSKQEAFSPMIKKDDFIFMTMGVNNERKKIDMVIEAFAVFLKKMSKGGNTNKYKLYLHTNTDEMVGGTDLETQILTLGIQSNILFTRAFKEGVIMYKHDLYKKYKASDCCITLSGGEGFNYLAAEGMIHGKPVIYLNYGGHADYLKDVGLPVKVKTTINARNIYMQWAIADIEDAATQMCRIVSDERLRESLGAKSKEKADKEFPLEIVFDKLLNTIEMNYGLYKKPDIYNFNLKRII